MNPPAENDGLVAAIRAEEAARQAHRRLDRMNGSIDRLSGEVSQARSEIRTQLDGVLLHLAQSTGFEQAHQQSRLNREFWLSFAAAVAAAAATALGIKFG